MKTTISLFLILIFGSALGQNLVPNGDFEGHGDCSEGASFSILNDWFRPEGGGTPDFFHSCSNATFPNTGSPSNIFGFQNPHSGDGYGGFAPYVENDELIEYLRVELTIPLQPNQEYCISFFLSWADSSSFSSKFLHVLFKEEDDWIYDEQDDGYADLAQVVFDDTDVTDGNGWKFFSKSFTASGGERYMTIGNFLKNNEMELSLIEYNQVPFYAYYFIDDVSLSPCVTSIDPIQSYKPEIIFDSITNEIRVRGTGIHAIRIIDMSGRLVDFIKPQSIDIALPNITFLPPGIYVISVTGDRGVESIKIRKE